MFPTIFRLEATSIPLAFTLLGFSLSPLPAGDSWPQFRGPSGDGQIPGPGLPLRWSEEENVAWKTPIHDRGWSSPVILDGEIWLTTATKDGKVMSAVCIDQASGRVVHDVEVFTNEKLREIHALNSYASPTPVIENGRVIVHFGSYGTACLETGTAEKLWERRDLPCDHFRGPGSSPILWEGLVIVHFDGADQQYVVALNKMTGETVWKRDRSNDYGTDNGDFMKAYSTPIVIDVARKQQLISAGSKAVTSYDPRTGEEIWQVTFPSFSSTARPLFGHGLVYVNTGFSKADLLAIRPNGTGDVTKSHVVWTVRKSVPSKPSQLLIGERIYMVHDRGIASCVNALTGEIVWRQRLKGEYSASPVASGERIYFLAQDGVTTVIRAADEFEILAQNTLEDGFMASPAAAGGALFLRTTTHLYRIEETAGSEGDDE